MSIQAKALYDYEGNDGELSFKTDDILTITSKGNGDGWWEATLKGATGFIPENYVMEISVAPPAAPRRALPVTKASAAASNYVPDDQDDDDDDHWDQDVPFSSSSSSTSPASPGTHGRDRASSTSNGTLSSTSLSSGRMSSFRRGTVRKNINRFSAFVKSGGEAFLMAETLEKVPSELLLHIVAGPRWQDSPAPYTVSVTEPTKKSKFKGVKSFIAYNIVPSNTGIAVSRRYKHFDWLHERLVDKFPSISIPPLPDKSAVGKFEDTFVEKRRYQLEKWLNRLARHPIMSQSEALCHFLYCNGEEKEWKAGKRKSEKDPFVGGRFFMCIDAPDDNVPADVETITDTFGKFSRNMEKRMEKVKESGERFTVFSNDIKNEFHRLGTSFSELVKDDWKEEGHKDGIWCWRDYCTECVGLSKAIDFAGTTFVEIGQSFAAQPEKDLSPFLEDTREYLGILPTYPDIVETSKTAYEKLKETKKLQEIAKAETSDVDAISSRCEIIANVTLAELDRFHFERGQDTRQMMEKYLQEQITFYQGVVGKLTQALQKFQDLPQ